MSDLMLILAAEEGVPPDHIAADLALPIAIVIFCGSVLLLLWSNYGLKKGALIYATAFFGFNFMLGVFWWFGAPGTPVATGLQNFPGQAPDEYQGRWYAFEPGSPRSQFFDVSNNFEDFQTPEEFVGTDDEEDPELSFLQGDLEQAEAIMLDQYFPTDEAGGPRIGANRRQELEEAAPEPGEDEVRGTPFFVAEPVEVRVTESDGIRVAAGRFQVLAVYAEEGTGVETRTEVVEESIWYAFKDPGALWFPSAVWTGIALALFLLSLFGLDRIEQREKAVRGQVQEPEDLATPIRQ